MSIITCKNLSKYYGPKLVLDNINLTIPQGKIFGLLGPNGAGKTTLIRIINRIILPTEGEITLNGEALSEKSQELIAYLPEERGLYRKMKVGEQLIYFARLKGMSKEEAIKNYKVWFEKFGITDWWTKKVEELSKGMAQKVQFIATVVHKPQLLILDEPFSGFDPVNVELIRKEILALRDQGVSIIISTHNMESVETLCDEIALINKSRVVISGKTHQIRKDFGDNNIEIVYSAEYKILGSGEKYKILSEEEKDDRRIAVLRILDGFTSNQVLADILTQDIQLHSFRELLPRMNDIFIKLVTNKEA